MLRVYKFKEKDSKLSIQCTNCQKYDHFANLCFRQTKCQICAKNHFTNQHYCQKCEQYGKSCIHTQIQCSNCKEFYILNSQQCSFYSKEKIEKSLNLKRKLEKDGLAVIVSNKINKY